jgi:hypothetical protein
VLDSIVVKRPSPKINKEKQNLCLDKGYDFQEINDSVIKKGYYYTFNIEEKNNL